MNKKGYVYADTKPLNIMIDDTKQVKVVDFENSLPIVENGSTAPDIFCFATFGYASPEQRSLAYTNKGRLYIQSDVYSLGAVLFEMLIPEHTPPMLVRDDFVRDTNLSIPLRLEYQTVISLSQQNKLAMVLRRALAPDYQERCANVELLNNEVQDVLRNC